MNASRSDTSAWRALAAVAAASAAMVAPYDVIGTTTRLLQACVEATDSTSAGLVVVTEDGRLHVLATTSHRAEEIEIYQVQLSEGPCVEATQTGEVVATVRLSDVVDRWPQLEMAFARAGYESVMATPLRWHAGVLGALNLFWSGPHEHSDELVALGRAFADVATLAIVHSGQITAAQVVERTRNALEERTVIEQAKGVLAHQRDITTDEAFGVLLRLANHRRELLSAVSAGVVEAASNGNRVSDLDA